MSNIYKNYQPTNYHKVTKLEPGERIRLGHYSLIESDGHYEIREGRKTLKRVSSLLKGVIALIAINRRVKDGS